MKKFINGLGIKLQRFMCGRYGIDQLYRVLLLIYLFIIILAAIIGKAINMHIYSAILAIGFIVIIFAFYRVFSKNLKKRREENEKWLSFANKISKHFRIIKDRWKFRKTHIFRKCPQCKSVLRLKKIKGSHKVSCPNCKKEFKIKVLF